MFKGNNKDVNDFFLVSLFVNFEQIFDFECDGLTSLKVAFVMPGLTFVKFRQLKILY